MSYSDWEIGVYSGGSNGAWTIGSGEGQILDYTGSTGIPAPTSSVGTQGRIFRFRGSGAMMNYSISSSVSSSMFAPIVSSSAYSISTWVRIDNNGTSENVFKGSSFFVGSGLNIKCQNPAAPLDSVFSLGGGIPTPGYRLILTTDDINSSNRGDGRLNLKLTGQRWASGDARVLCSGSYTTGSWYRIRLDLFEKENVPSVKSDELYAYVYNTGSQSWEEVGHLSIDQFDTNYIPWNSTYARVGIAHCGNYNTVGTADVLFSSDGFEISQVPWDRRNPG